MPVYTEVTPDVLGIAAEVISHYHEALLDAKIGFIFQEEAGKKLGKIVLGNAAKVSDKQRVAGLDLDYIITIAEDMWQSLTLIQKRALVDHELCHCDFTIGEARMRGHDVEEFTCIIQRYGLWKEDLVKLGLAVEQAKLPGFEPKHNGAVLSIRPQMMMTEAE